MACAAGVTDCNQQNAYNWEKSFWPNAVRSLTFLSSCLRANT